MLVAIEEVIEHQRVDALGPPSIQLEDQDWWGCSQ